MAIMGRRKQANKRNWNRLNKEIDESNKPKEEPKSKEISEDEHNKRVELLREIGLLKE